jgi:hypothetical protein
MIGFKKYPYLCGLLFTQGSWKEVKGRNIEMIFD